MTLTKATAAAYLELVSAGQLEDRGEYSVYDFREMYSLTEEDASALAGLLEDDRVLHNVERCLQVTTDLTTEDTAKTLTDTGHPQVAEYLEEAVHGGLEGVEIRDYPATLRAFADLATYLVNRS